MEYLKVFSPIENNINDLFFKDYESMELGNKRKISKNRSKRKTRVGEVTEKERTN